MHDCFRTSTHDEYWSSLSSALQTRSNILFPSFPRSPALCDTPGSRTTRFPSPQLLCRGSECKNRRKTRPTALAAAAQTSSAGSARPRRLTRSTRLRRNTGSSCDTVVRQMPGKRRNEWREGWEGSDPVGKAPMMFSRHDRLSEPTSVPGVFHRSRERHPGIQ